MLLKKAQSEREANQTCGHERRDAMKCRTMWNPQLMPRERLRRQEFSIGRNCWVFLTAIILGLSVTSAASARIHVDRVVVYKQQRKLVLLSGMREVKCYRIALGGEPVGRKTRQGDHRTPEGVYVLDSRNANSRFHKAFHISYPNAKDREAAQKLGANPGGDIMLHGLPKQYGWLGKAHTLHDWTDGCIAVTNEEMDELWKLISVGTTIEIKP
jgi:murein L,D-transpeptidase YafK